jgi:hypothetical protein
METRTPLGSLSSADIREKLKIKNYAAFLLYLLISSRVALATIAGVSPGFFGNITALDELITHHAHCEF